MKFVCRTFRNDDGELCYAEDYVEDYITPDELTTIYDEWMMLWAYIRSGDTNLENDYREFVSQLPKE